MLIFFLRKLCRLCNNVEKYCKAGQATYNNTGLAHFILDTYLTLQTHTQNK